jgi:hypothetical protein
MRKKIFIAAVLVFSTFHFSFSQSPLSFKVDILGHAEIRNGGMKDSVHYDPRFMVSRERLIADYSDSSSSLQWNMHLNLQHTAIWGQNGGLKIFEGWGKLSTQWGGFVQVGRQALSYDDERIIGMDDWAMAAQSHDVLRLGYEHGAHKLHLIAAYNQDGDVEETGSSYYTEGGFQSYKTMLVGWYHLEPPKFPASLSLIFINMGMQAGTKGVDEHNEYQQIYGGYAKFEKPWLTIEGSYYRQGGHEEHGLPIDAWMAALKATWKPIQLLDVSVGCDHMSGDEYFNVPAGGSLGMIQHKVIRGFNPVWGSHHKFYGAMDFFYVSTYYSGFTPGLQNLYTFVDLHPTEKFDFGLGYHYFAIPADIKNLDHTLGHELELAAAYKFSSEVTLSAGFSYMVGSETMDKLKRSTEDSRLTWAWVDLRFKN